jgi:hypothetical protein
VVWIRPITHLSKSYFARDLLQTARATAAFRFHLNIAPGHRKIHTSIDFQGTSLPARAGKVICIMSSIVPKERFPELVARMFPLMGHDDHDNMTRIWQMVMPAPAFAGVKELIKKAIGKRLARTHASQLNRFYAGDGIRTREHLRDRALNPAPLTWLGNPRSKWFLSAFYG